MNDRRIHILVLTTALVLGILAGTRDSRAEPVDQTRTFAGVVVQLGDGTVREFCVDLGGSERSGIELLRMTGMSFVSEDSVLGSMVCRIGGDGCDFPTEKCSCQCQDLGPDCRYWSYNTMENGRWAYAAVGPSARVIHHGDVDGWAWGRGTVSIGAQPPTRSFEAICAAALAPPPTATVAPTATRPAPTRTPTVARTATRAPAPGTRSGATPRPGVTTRPSATPHGTFTEQTRVAGTPSSAMADPVMADATSSAEPLDPDRQATLAALPTAFAAFATAQAEATMLAREADQAGTAEAPQLSEDPPTVEPTAATTWVAARALGARAGEGSGAEAEVSGSTDQTDSAMPNPVGYIAIVMVLLLLGGVLVWLRR